METQDVRWKQRFQNFLKALALLEKAVIQYQEQRLSELKE